MAQAEEADAMKAALEERQRQEQVILEEQQRLTQADAAVSQPDQNMDFTPAPNTLPQENTQNLNNH
jgi:hypothetical protein